MKQINKNLLQIFYDSLMFMFPTNTAVDKEFKFEKWIIGSNLNAVAKLTAAIKIIHKILILKKKKKKKIILCLDKELEPFFDDLLQKKKFFYTSNWKNVHDALKDKKLTTHVKLLVIISANVENFSAKKINTELPVIFFSTNSIGKADYYVPANFEFHSSILLLKTLLKKIS